ncbi:MAG: phosphoglycerate mutase (2,3-diphosphoglycerate-independent) [Phycisphaerae bacterium]|nr:phosphoglycerate mutase (2,3-diphosphoglycerate-independent) [Phycisphaerae bacterium]
MDHQTRQLHDAPVVLGVRDGWGQNPNPDHATFNAIELADTPVADRLMNECPWTLVRTSGEDVGLPVTGDGPTMGNSEVGHQNIGAGRIVDQELLRIPRSIRDGSFYSNPGLREAFDHATATGGSLHLLGLVSDGKVHSDLEHLFALIDLASRLDFPSDRLVIHVITDGRDTDPTKGVAYVQQLLRKIEHEGRGRIGSVIGRYYAMDRDHRWDRVQRAYQCLAGSIDRSCVDPIAAIKSYYDNPDSPSLSGDEFISPTQIGDDPDQIAATRIRDGDSVIFFNFRGDRPRQITRAFTFDDDAWRTVQGGGFDRGPAKRNLFFCTLTSYEAGLPVTVAMARPAHMQSILGQVVSDHGLRQFRCAETEKFPHVTFFFNDYREEAFDGETRVIIPSPKDVATYDQKPEMSAEAVTDAVIDRLEAVDCEPLIVVNFANGDMVGHTGVLDAVVKAVEVVDRCVGRIVEATLKRGGTLLVTADHGNAEQMRDPTTGSPHTAHTVYDVPLLLVSSGEHAPGLRNGGRLADIAPTILELLGIEPPEQMTGESLLLREND